MPRYWVREYRDMYTLMVVKLSSYRGKSGHGYIEGTWLY